jgi:hypothetical protein
MSALKTQRGELVNDAMHADYTKKKAEELGPAGQLVLILTVCGRSL